MDCLGFGSARGRSTRIAIQVDANFGHGARITLHCEPNVANQPTTVQLLIGMVIEMHQIATAKQSFAEDSKLPGFAEAADPQRQSTQGVNSNDRIQNPQADIHG